MNYYPEYLSYVQYGGRMNSEIKKAILDIIEEVHDYHHNGPQKIDRMASYLNTFLLQSVTIFQRLTLQTKKRRICFR